MRIAKICDNNKEANNLYKIFNYCIAIPNIAKENIISNSEIKEMEKEIYSAIYDEYGKNLIEKWRNEYLAHYSKLVDPLSTQKKFPIFNKKMEKIVKTISDILTLLFKKFKININETIINCEFEEIKKDFKFLCDNCNIRN